MLIVRMAMITIPTKVGRKKERQRRRVIATRKHRRAKNRS
jgi:hypothetical protein